MKADYKNTKAGDKIKFVKLVLTGLEIELKMAKS